MFSPDTNAFLDDNGDFDRFIVDYRPQLPQGWKDVSSSSEGRFEKEFLLPAYFAQAYFEIPFNIRLCLKKKKDTNNQEGNCGYYAPLNEININIFLFPSNDFSIGKIRFPPEEIYGIILHEGVHLLQALMGQGNRNIEFTGLPYPRRTEFRFYEKEAEKALKLEFATNGLNPDIVNFYHLDDVEFYALLLDCIVDFIKTYIKDPISKNKADPCHINFESHIDSYIDSEPFFESLKNLQIDKYILAVEQFKEALHEHRESLETMYVCKVRKSKYLRK
jgi:hypothetical protein